MIRFILCPLINTHLCCPLINTPSSRGVIISQPKMSLFSREVTVLRVPDPQNAKAHLGTVNTNLSHHLGTPRSSAHKPGFDMALTHEVTVVTLRPDTSDHRNMGRSIV